MSKSQVGTQAQIAKLTELVNNLAQAIQAGAPVSNTAGKGKGKAESSLPETRPLFSFAGKDWTISEAKAKIDGHRYFTIEIGSGSAFVKRANMLNARKCHASAEAFEVLAEYFETGAVTEQLNK